MTPSSFRRRGDVLILLGPERLSLAGSEYLEVFHGRVEGRPAAIDLDMEKRAQSFVARIIREGLVCSAHDCSEGGLLVAAVESALTAAPKLGLDLRVNSDLPPHLALFGEGPSRILLSVAPENAGRILESAQEEHLPAATCGQVAEQTLRVVYNDGDILSMRVADLFNPWDQAMESWFHK